MGINDFIAATVRRALPDSISSQIERIEGAVEGSEDYPVCYLYPKKDCKLFQGMKDKQWDECFYVEHDPDYLPSGYSVECILGDDYRDVVLESGTFNERSLSEAASCVASLLEKLEEKL